MLVDKCIPDMCLHSICGLPYGKSIPGEYTYIYIWVYIYSLRHMLFFTLPKILSKTKTQCYGLVWVKCLKALWDLAFSLVPVVEEDFHSRARICKRLRSPGIVPRNLFLACRYDKKGYRTNPPDYIGLESIPWLLKHLQIQALLSTNCCVFPILCYSYELGWPIPCFVAAQLPVYEERIVHSWAMSSMGLRVPWTK